MSYIRMGQDGQYVDIPHGSNYYIYHNGHDIEGWSEPQFAALIGSVVDEIDWGASDGEYGGAAGRIKHAFAEHFGGWDDDYRGGISPPERAEIFCQCLDSRIDSLELTDGLHDAVRQWADEHDGLRDCKFCGEELRPYIRDDTTAYVCNDDECRTKLDAEHYGLTVEEMEQANHIFERTLQETDDFDAAHDAEWEFIEEHGDV